jgi:hypothetical protein
MSITTQTRLALVASGAALALAGGAAALGLTGGETGSASAGSSVSRATALLEGKRLTGYVNGSVTEATSDRSADLCRGGRFVYESNYTSEAGGAFQRTGGRWRVVAARIDRGGSGWATVRWHTSSDRGTLGIEANARGVRVDGYPVEVTRSRAC